MLEFSGLDNVAYDEAATQITYCKLFPLILQDFTSRLDSVAMMNPGNLPANTIVAVTPGQVVQVIPGSGTGSTVSPAQGTGTGQVIPVFNGQSPHPTNNSLVAQKKAIKDAGGRSVDVVLNNTTGG